MATRKQRKERPLRKRTIYELIVHLPNGLIEQLAVLAKLRPSHELAGFQIEQWMKQKETKKDLKRILRLMKKEKST